MDTSEKPRRRWWRKKRWWAAGVVWLAVAYPLALGPLAYADALRWVPREKVRILLRPYGAAVNLLPAWATEPVSGYLRWCDRLGDPDRDDAIARLREAVRRQEELVRALRDFEAARRREAAGPD